MASTVSEFNTTNSVRRNLVAKAFSTPPPFRMKARGKGMSCKRSQQPMNWACRSGNWSGKISTPLPLRCAISAEWANR